MRVVLITGISGSGKTIAANALEDDGYFCIDNLPMKFLQEVVMSLQESGHERVGVAIDARSGEVTDLPQIVNGLSRYGHDVKVVFLDARTDVLVSRYSESRRRHPLAHLPGMAEPPTLIESIERERELMQEMREIGNTLDTSDLHPNALRRWLRELVGSERTSLTLVFESFAFKYGVPLDADLVFDVRCLPNPHWIPELRPLTGRDEAVANYLCSIPAVNQMIEHISGFLDTWLPSYMLEQRSYLTVALGCTGGQHRSVYVVEALAARFARHDAVLVRHRAIAMRAHSPQLNAAQTP